MDQQDTDPKDTDPKDLDRQDAAPRPGSSRDVAIILVISVLMSVFTVFVLAQAFPPQQHDMEQGSPTEG